MGRVKVSLSLVAVLALTALLAVSMAQADQSASGEYDPHTCDEGASLECLTKYRDCLAHLDKADLADKPKVTACEDTYLECLEVNGCG